MGQNIDFGIMQEKQTYGYYNRKPMNARHAPLESALLDKFNGG